MGARVDEAATCRTAKPQCNLDNQARLANSGGNASGLCPMYPCHVVVQPPPHRCQVLGQVGGAGEGQEPARHQHSAAEVGGREWPGESSVCSRAAAQRCACMHCSESCHLSTQLVAETASPLSPPQLERSSRLHQSVARQPKLLQLAIQLAAPARTTQCASIYTPLQNILLCGSDGKRCFSSRPVRNPTGGS